LRDGAIVVDGSGSSTDSPTGSTPIDFRYETLDGGAATLSELGDNPVVLNFFASWCPACIAEMPDFEAVYQAMGSEVDFLGLALQDRPESAAALVGDTGITYTVGTDDDGAIYEMFKGLGMPTTVFIDSDGVVREVHSGQLSADALREKIDDVLLS
jgi:thiol-disulfide isomerase/thioredoxin